MDERSPTLQPDRYVSFCGIDCDGMAERLLPLARDRLAAGGHLTNPFWRRFDEKAAALRASTGTGADALYLVCSHVMYLVELFEDGDGEGRALLEEIELTCC